MRSRFAVAIMLVSIALTSPSRAQQIYERRGDTGRDTERRVYGLDL